MKANPERQRTFLLEAATPGATIERRRSWVVVYRADGTHSGAALRGADLWGLQPRYVSATLALTKQGRRLGTRLGRLRRALNHLNDAYAEAHGEADATAAVEAAWDQLWKLFFNEPAPADR